MILPEMLPQFFDRAASAGGILHFANAGKCTWQEYAQWALDCCRDAGISLKARTVGALKLSENDKLGRAPPRLFRAFHRQIYGTDRHVTSGLARGSC